MVTIRKAELPDLPYLYDICFRTAYIGKSAKGYVEDPNKVGHYFAAPYLVYDAGIVFVAVVKGIPRGYVLGVADSNAYAHWLNTFWLPRVRLLYSCNEGADQSDFDAFLNSVLQEDTRFPEELGEYPAHLHIDLLPEIQGKGLGKKLMFTFFDECRNTGVRKVHLEVAKQNEAAVAFYRKIGMHLISEHPSSIRMGYDL